MNSTHCAKAKEIRALARSFLELAEETTLAEYKVKLIQTAASLTNAAKALEEDGASQTRLNS